MSRYPSKHKTYDVGESRYPVSYKGTVYEIPQRIVDALPPGVFNNENGRKYHNEVYVIDPAIDSVEMLLLHLGHVIDDGQ
jgi:hypothetical protein